MFMTHFRQYGSRVFGLGIIASGVVALLLGDFLPGQVAPKGLPARVAFAYAAGVVMVGAGVGLEIRRTAQMATVALIIFFALVILANLDVLTRHLSDYGAYSGLAEQLALAIAALMIFAQKAELAPAPRKRLIRSCQQVFGVCVLLFGGAHFVYLNLTTPLVPAWLPPSRAFWAYATGAAQIVAAVAILTRVHERLAATLLTVMYAAFTPLVHLPMLVAAPTNHFVWSENALNLALTGAAWVVADSCVLASRRTAVLGNRDQSALG